jgi:hypothetical protein
VNITRDLDSILPIKINDMLVKAHTNEISNTRKNDFEIMKNVSISKLYHRFEDVAFFILPDPPPTSYKY